MSFVLAAALAIAMPHAVRAQAIDCDAPAAAAIPAPVPFSTAPLRIGVALGSGSAHGLAHIGVIQALEAHGLDVKVVAGTSVGAIVGGLWASGYSGRQIEALSEGSGWEDAGAFAASWQGVFSNKGLREQLAKFFGKRPIERWPRRFGAVATHLDSGTKRVLDRGDGALAIQASTAIPVLFTPVAVAGERLADGALVEPVPAATARALGADFVIAIDVAYRPYEAEARGLAQFGFQTLHILINALSAEQARHADHALRLDVHHRLMECGGPSLVRAGRDAVDAAWPAIERALREAIRRAAP
jgi:NTE family protein